MKYVDEYRSRSRAKKLSAQIKKIMPPREIKFMEVCGTHTQGFYRFGIDKLLPGGLKLISGPGCPVCVSTGGYIDRAIKLAGYKDTIIATFGDMLRVPGGKLDLERQRQAGRRIEVVYSPLDALGLARKNPAKKVIFLAVGFETTAPLIASSIISAKKEKLKNMFFLASLKRIAPAMRYLLKDKRQNIEGFLCPGHVSSITGTRPYEFIPRQYRIACCVAGFEPVDILEGLYFLLRQVVKNRPIVDNQYIRAVNRCGNTYALKLMQQVFCISSADWRGLGKIPESGFRIKKEFRDFDAEKIFSLRQQASGSRQQASCKCSDVLKGLLSPDKCNLFKKACTPEHPVGPCMISAEGACNVYYKYKK
ncbi:MAG: hydrogenase formation protein HypD [Candidatus Omnitrophica bacterium]|nr:hydrogenase formation protein HypD [Candidatus Omnitrophota bacterium]